MDRVFSARVEESVIQQIESLAGRLRTTKKSIIENAVLDYASKMEQEKQTTVFDQTSGAWRRKESAVKTAENTRKEFRRSMEKRRR